MLTIDIRNIADYETVCLAPAPPYKKGDPIPLFEFRWGPDHVLVPHVLTIAIVALPVGLCEIADDNIDEWVYRFDAWQDAFGASLRYADGRDLRIGRADFERFKGLRVNASPMTRTKFDAHLCREKARRV